MLNDYVKRYSIDDKIYLLPILIGIFELIGVVKTYIDFCQGKPPITFLAIILLGALFVFVTKVVYEVDMLEDGRFRFRSMHSGIVLAPEQLISIQVVTIKKVERWCKEEDFASIEYFVGEDQQIRRKFYIYRRIHKYQELLTKLRNANPTFHEVCAADTVEQQPAEAPPTPSMEEAEPVEQTELVARTESVEEALEDIEQQGTASLDEARKRLGV